MNTTEPLKTNIGGMLKLFVYGTLKRGFWNHDRFCQGAITVEEAVVKGRLFEMPSGIPVLQVPEVLILAQGTTDPIADTATQAQASAHMFDREPTLELTPDTKATPWVNVYGELITFNDPETRIPAIDRLEGFHPGAVSLYRRILSPVQSNGIILPAWLYAYEFSNKCTYRELLNGAWRPKKIDN